MSEESLSLILADFYSCHLLLTNAFTHLSVAGVEGIEPPTKVLETSIMPFNYTPSVTRVL